MESNVDGLIETNVSEKNDKIDLNKKIMQLIDIQI